MLEAPTRGRVADPLMAEWTILVSVPLMLE
jgi:hypothetical protein